MQVDWFPCEDVAAVNQPAPNPVDAVLGASIALSSCRRSLTAISLFSGAGGLDLGCEQAGFSTRALSSKSTPPRGPPWLTTPRDSCRSSTATRTKGALFADITLTPPELLLERAGLRRKEATLLHGGPPCVAFSKTGYWLPYKREDRDEKATLIDWYAGMVAETKPMAVLMENVYGLVYKRSRHHLRRFLTAMDEAGYEMRYEVLLAADYGVPQIRQRLFCVGIRRDLFSSDPTFWQFPWPEQSHAGPHETRKLWRTELPPHRTAGEALDGLRDAGQPVGARGGRPWHVRRGAARDPAR